ncbi:acyl-CoA/acyl-ACP dehydrogenase [Moraxella nasovis]|uniref:acyl-CoA dehydrogenase family protein n=1 Tax=Moraxella nasovis TaxID=2904121 RepID=UPI001F610858|nr:acyl-CoA dehydrogenase family protein [Moraxella nasovis]UNU72567.1 acyl-CoA/acyl-ACP dehydrogenase [Moraxella nasovis]
MTTFNLADQTAFLDNIASISADVLAPKVSDIDQGYYPLNEMSALGKAGLFAPHLNEYGNRFDLAILANANVGRVCGTTAFLTWCHQVMGLYLDQSPNDSLKHTILPRHTLADTFGGTALSNPMKTWANIEPMRLIAKKDGSGYTISGILPWISHIQAGQYCGAVAKIDGTDSDVFFVLSFDHARQGKWQLHPCPAFAGMEGSSTLRIELNDYPITKDDIIAMPCKEYIARIRGAFVLMQMGIGAGIIMGAIDDIKQGTAVSNAFLEDQAGTLSNELDRLVARTLSLAKTPFETDKNFFLDVLNVREQGALLSLKATQAGMLHQGAKGYLMSANPQRRLREAQFVAIVTPAIKHLRYLSHQLMGDVMPKTEPEYYL